MDTFIAAFTANGKFYSQSIDIVTDETFIVDEDDGGKRLFTVDHSGNVTKGDAPEYIGKFVLGMQERWGYVPKAGKQIWTDRTINHVEGLLEAEREVFKQLLEAS